MSDRTWTAHGARPSCCDLHHNVGCCDPNDCGPCCENCPTCPTLKRQRARELADRMAAFADELVEPMLCKQPAGGLGPGTHCAACCYGSGLIIENDEDQALVDAATSLNKAAAVIRAAIERDAIQRERRELRRGHYVPAEGSDGAQ